jgi:hypothetical protein
MSASESQRVVTVPVGNGRTPRLHCIVTSPIAEPTPRSRCDYDRERPPSAWLSSQPLTLLELNSPTTKSCGAGIISGSKGSRKEQERFASAVR